MIVRSAGQHEIGNGPISRQDLLLVTAEVVERSRGAAQVPQFGDGVVRSGEEEILVGRRPGDGGNPTGVMRHGGLDDGAFLGTRVVYAHVSIARTGGDETAQGRKGNVDEDFVTCGGNWGRGGKEVEGK